MRWTIGRKVFALAAFLAALMVASALFTTAKLVTAAGEVRELSEVFVPVMDAAADLTKALGDEEVLLSRAALIDPADPRFPVLEGAFRAAEARRQALAAATLSALTAARDDPHISEADRTHLEEIATRLAMISERADRDAVTGHRVVESRRAGELYAANMLVDELQDRQDSRNAALATLIDDVEQYVSDAAGRARRDAYAALAFDLVVSFLAVLFGLGAAAVMSRALTRPIERLATGTLALEEGRYEIDLPVTTTDEVADLTRRFNHLARELRQKARIKDTFGRYLDPRVVERLLADSEAEAAGRALGLAGERRQATIFFSDVAGFTAISEALTADALVRLMNAYFSRASRPIGARKGVIDKYIGDSVMAFWCAPFVDEGAQARSACLAALDQGEALRALREAMPEILGLKSNLPAFDIRIGLASGEAIVGNVGAEQARSFTVMGNAVNLASRLEGTNKLYGTRILVDEATRAGAGEGLVFRELDRITVMGQTQPVAISELLGMAGTVPDRRLAALEPFAEGLMALRARDWGAAEERFRAALAAWPDDQAAALHLERVAAYRLDPPPPGWDGTWRMLHK